MKQFYCVIYDPRSGKRKKLHAWHELRKFFLKKKYSIQLIDINKEPLPKGNEFKHYTAIIVIGGDGLIRRSIAHLQLYNVAVPIAIVPRGSANVLAKSLSLPFSLDKVYECILEHNIAHIDVAKVNDDYFMSAFAMGYVSERVTSVDQQIKNQLGIGAYFTAFIRKRHMKHIHFKFHVDGIPYTVDGNSLFIVNAASLFGFVPKRAMDLEDGVFELAVTTNRSYLSWPLIFYYYYFKHKPPKHLFIKSGKSFTIENDLQEILQLDGDEWRTKKTTIKISILKKQQQIIIPKYAKTT